MTEVATAMSEAFFDGSGGPDPDRRSASGVPPRRIVLSRHGYAEHAGR